MALHASKTRPGGRPKEFAFTVWTDEDSARLSSLVKTELGRQRVKPLAHRTLALIAESALEPIPDGLGYRVVDRHGDPRFLSIDEESQHDGKNGKSGKRSASRATRKPEDEEDEGAPAIAVDRIPLTIGEYVTELRDRYPDLFDALPPEPDPEKEPKPARSFQETMRQVKAVGARLIESQSALAGSLARGSTARGRSLAASASGAMHNLGSGLSDRFRTKSVSEETAGTASVSPPAPPIKAEREHPGMRSAIESRLPAFRQLAGDRRIMAASIGAFAVTGLVLAAMLLPRSGTEPAVPEPNEPPSSGTAEAPANPTPPETRPQAKAGTNQAIAPNAPAVEQGATSDPESQPADEEPAPADAVSGKPEVIDTATLKFGTRTVQLFGVEWVRGGAGEDLRRYLATRSVTCRPAAGSKAFLCNVDGRDLSEVVLFNGGGRASPEATPDLVGAEDHARSERLGIWKR